jgi:membrane protein implicated in regulation of membrane protease activity
MNTRIIAVLILGVYFLVSIFNAFTIASVSRLVGDWAISSAVLGVAVSLATLLVAFWVYEDYDSHHEEELVLLRQRLTNAESKTEALWNEAEKKKE